MQTIIQKSKLAAVFAGVLLSSSALADGAANYEVTITNLTRGQAFTPVLVASHRGAVPLFELGTAAGAELSALAEGGDTGPLNTVLDSNHRVIDTAVSTGLIMPGMSATVTVSARKGARNISLASMLIPTNDSFIAINDMAAPKHGRSVVYFTPAYDAGTELNDENCMHIPGPVCGGEGGSPGAGGEGYVHVSGGIAGIGDLAADTYDWRNPAAKIEIRRVPGE